MNIVYWIIVPLLAITSYFFPSIILPLFIILAAGYIRWLNVMIVSVSKTAHEDTQKVIKTVNDCVGMINQQTAVIKRMHVIGSDLDEVEREMRRQQKEINQVKNQVKHK
jgi:hypothetical protein